jgi:hypothetical protein
MHLQCYVCRCGSKFLDHLLTAAEGFLIDAVSALQAVRKGVFVKDVDRLEG